MYYNSLSIKTSFSMHGALSSASKSLCARAKTALTLGVDDFFHHETWAPYFPPAGSGPGGVDLPATVYLRAPASQALLQLVCSGELSFASGAGGSLAAVGRLFGYIGGLISVSQRTAMGQADVVFCDLFVRLTQGDATSIAEEDTIELTEGWRNSQWPGSMVALPLTRAASSVDLQRSDVCMWSTDAIAAALLERLRGAGLATQSGNGTLASDDGSKPNTVSTGGAGAAASRRACSRNGWCALPAQSTTYSCPSWKRTYCAQITTRSAHSRWRSQVGILSNS